MRTLRFAAATLLAGVASLLLCCSFLLGTPEYSIELTVERSAYKSVDAQAVGVTYRVTTSEQEDFRARYELSGIDGSLLESGIVSDILLGSPQTRVLDLAGYQGFGEGKYAFRLVGQTRMGDGTYRDLAFLDRTVEFWVDDTPPAGEGDLEVSPPILQRYASSTDVTITHSELPTTAGSPVHFLYTTNGDDPLANGILYDGNPFTVSIDQMTTTVRLLAVDAAGWTSGTVERDYRFTRITSLDPPGVPQAGTPIVKIYGFGFVNISPLSNVDIKVFDKNGVLIDLRFPPNIISETVLEIILDMGADPSVVADGCVPGQIVVTSHDPAAVSTAHPFFVLPP